MSQVDKILRGMRNAPQDVYFEDDVEVCQVFFGEPRRSGRSHLEFKMPWFGDPRINLQKGQDGKAKAYQVRQVINAIDMVRTSAQQES